ncbi:MAG TPA: lyase family protein, partial [Clostridia bacterium]|nr:lyase family protein [Clostridia bacterium]
MSNKSNKLWSGRFTKSSSMDDFHSSIDVDSRMIREDIMGSAAHAKMLAAQGIISHEDAAAITEELHKILASFEEGKIVFSSSDEDIHMLIESLLTQRIGDAGKRLHTGRSRNDQVALDCRMYLIKGANETIQRLLKLEEALLHTAQIHLNTIMPGYTHMQKAQPISLAHYLMAYFEMFRRDIERLC